MVKKSGKMERILSSKIAGTFAADKFIVIKRKEARVESNPDPDLKPHHKFGEKVQGKPGTGWPSDGT